MKKILVLFLAVLMLASAFAIPVGATTKSDLLALAKKSPVYHYFKASVENAYNTADITDEQAGKLKPLIEEFLVVVDEDRGMTAKNGEKIFYSQETIDKVVSLINQACSILNWTVKKVDKGNGDLIWYFYDNNGKLLMDYDGDSPVDTSASVSDNSVAYIACGASLMALATFLFISLRRKSEDNA